MTLAEAFRRYKRDIAAGEKARADLLEAMKSAVASGMTQGEIARELGWPKQRVSIWLKPPKPVRKKRSQP